MNVTPEEAQRLLKEIALANKRAEKLRKQGLEAIAESRSIRKESVERAIAAGVPRADIAKALGTHRNMIYKILND